MLGQGSPSTLRSAICCFHILLRVPIQPVVGGRANNPLKQTRSVCILCMQPNASRRTLCTPVPPGPAWFWSCRHGSRLRIHVGSCLTWATFLFPLPPISSVLTVLKISRSLSQIGMKEWLFPVLWTSLYCVPLA